MNQISEVPVLRRFLHSHARKFDINPREFSGPFENGAQFFNAFAALRIAVSPKAPFSLPTLSFVLRGTTNAQTGKWVEFRSPLILLLWLVL
jgi:hypothetical protein